MEVLWIWISSPDLDMMCLGGAVHSPSALVKNLFCNGLHDHYYYCYYYYTVVVTCNYLQYYNTCSYKSILSTLNSIIKSITLSMNRNTHSLLSAGFEEACTCTVYRV